MKREMTPREKLLLGVLAVLLVIFAYYYIFYLPVSEETEACSDDILVTEDLIVQAETKAAKMKRMQAELNEIFASGEDVKGLPEYDNSRSVIRELSRILADAISYDVSFYSAETEEHTVRRDMSLQYECSSYQDAKRILEEIHGSDYRNLMKDLTLTLSEDMGASRYFVDVDITYYEYRESGNE